MIDLRPDLIAALQDPAVGAALAQHLAPRLREALATEDPLLSVRDGAKHLGMGLAAFRTALLRDSTLRSLAIGTGRVRRFRRSDLEGWLAKRKPRARTP